MSNGNGNGKSLLHSYNIFLNSKNRDVNYYNLVSSGTPNYLAYCGWNLKQIIKKSISNSYFTISVKSLILPFSFDNISVLNKSFVFIYNTTPYTINVEEGNPNITQLITDIKNKILLAVPTILTNDFSITYDSASQTISIFNNTAFSMTFNFASNFIGTMLGFEANIVVASGGGEQTSTTNINVNPLECVFVRSDNLSFSSSYESIVGKSDISDIIAIIPIVVSSGNYIIYNDSSAFESRLNDDRIDNISLYLTSAVDDDHLLSLFLNWTIQIQINEYKIENSLIDKIELNPVIQNKNEEINKMGEGEGKEEIDFLKQKEKELQKKLDELTLKRKLKNK